MLVEFEITGAGEFKAQLETLEARLRNKEDILEHILRPIHFKTIESFQTQSDYNGTPWARLKPETIKAKGHNKILWGKNTKDHQAGELQESLKMGIEGDEGWEGVNAYSNGFQYGLSHQFGSEKRNIPARPFLPMDANGDIPSDVVDNILEMLSDYLVT